MVELIARRYGQALFDLILESGQMDKEEQDVHMMITELTTAQDFMSILNHPKLSEEQKIEMVETVFKDKVSNHLVGFLVLAIQKKRQENIIDILKYTLSKIEAYKGFVTAYVTSAIELSDKDKSTIVKNLEQSTGKKIALVSEVDQSIIGGLRIRINDRVVDNTIKEKIHRMARDVFEAKV